MTINEEALAIRLQYNGILTTASKVPLKDRHDLSVLYTPGVAEPCKLIKENKDLSFDYTCRGNMVAIISDGTRVLGLGDIGPEAAIPVMYSSKLSVTLTHFLFALTLKIRINSLRL